MRDTRFIFVEGIMGTGKSTAMYSLVLHLRREGIPVRGMWEGPTVDEPDHPLRVGPTLPHPYAPWEDLSIDGYVEESLRRWRSYVAQVAASPEITVCDGLLFHGNMTDLMLMDAPEPRLRQYIAAVLSALEELRPVLIYLRRPDIAGALRAIVEERRSRWQDTQVNWKLSSPLAVRHGWEGFGGLVDLYTAYCTVCDRIVRNLNLPKLVIDHRDDWDDIYGRIAAFLGLPVEKQPFEAARFT